jgi:hypothetical protein
MGFTAKNLTKLQPKTRVFSTDYKSPTGSKGLIILGVPYGPGYTLQYQLALRDSVGISAAIPNAENS